jgi:hypothetical protein
VTLRLDLTAEKVPLLEHFFPTLEDVRPSTLLESSWDKRFRPESNLASRGNLTQEAAAL